SAPVLEPVPALQEQQTANALLSSIFSGPVPARAAYGQPRVPAGPVPVPPRSTPAIPPGSQPGSAPGIPPSSTPPRPSAPSIAATVAAAMQPPVVAPPVSIPGAQITGSAQLSVPPLAPGRVPTPPLPGNASDAGRMRLEIVRLHSQIKKLEAELSAE